MVKVRFYENIDDNLLKIVVIVSKHNGKWVFCKHKERDTYELPAGHREIGEEIEKTAQRELWEETGAQEYDLIPICVYSVAESNSHIEKQNEAFGMLYYAEIRSFGKLPHFEIEEVKLFDALPINLTYPHIQPILIKKAMGYICI